MTLTLVPLSGFILCAVLHILARKWFPRMKLLDFPERYGLTRERLPYPTGILAVLAFFVIFPHIEPVSMQFFGLILAIILLSICCFIDDRTPLSPTLRLCVQIAAALLIVMTGSCVGGRVCSLTNPLAGVWGGEILELNTWHISLPFLTPLPIPSTLLTVLWLGLTINALNWFDGIPGQVSLLSVIGFMTIGLLSLSARVDQVPLAEICFLLAGIAAACLLFDFPPPRVVMGDTGAMFFGLMLGVVTIYAGGKVATAFLVLGVPLIDLFIVIARRILSGHSPLKGSKQGEHLHHRLRAKGWSDRSIILLTATIGSTFGITALFLSTIEKVIAVLVLGAVMLTLSWYTNRESKDEAH